MVKASLEKGLLNAVGTDVAGKTTIKEASEELKKMLAKEELKDCIVLVMAIKHDLSEALLLNEGTKKLGIDNIKRPWLI